MKNEANPPELRLKKLLCRRTGRQFEPEKHEHCPYCFGSEAEILGGNHEDFCDYRRGVDPVSFGLPTDVQHHELG